MTDEETIFFFKKAYLVSCIDLHKLCNHVRLSFAIDKMDAEIFIWDLFWYTI